MRIRAVILIFVMVLATPSLATERGAKVGGHGGYCDQADSTASTQRCLKRHLDSAQRRLNIVYQKLNGSLEGEKQEELKELQQSWLQYRDAECMWEGAQPQTPALKRIHELSCMARVTEDRLNILSVVLGDAENPDDMREYGAFPRWMNVLAKDHPDIYWDYGIRHAYDLNCDGDDEFIMEGVQIARQKGVVTPKQENKKTAKAGEEPQMSNDPVTFASKKMIAIVENPALGRPKAQVIALPVLQNQTEDALCNARVGLVMRGGLEAVEPAAGAKDDGTDHDAQEEGDAPMVCAAKLIIKDKGCDEKTISWTGKGFALEQEVSETK